MENCEWDIGPARATGLLNSFLAPLDRPYPMVATADIGRIAAQALLCSSGDVIEIEGPTRYSQHQVAELLGSVLNRPVRARPVARGNWETLFRSQGSERPQARLEMLDGFNSGWIDFEQPAHERLRGTTELQTVLNALAVRN
jgi:uncharacterized protein YbjT (DUF2867 family)